MKVVLDTHAFIWMDSLPAKLSALGASLLLNPAAVRLLSVVSVWEILIKMSVGKLSLHASLPTILAHHQARGLVILPVTLDHVLTLETLPPVHKDPFDRMLVAQAKSEGAVLLSADPVFSQYPVQVIW